MASIGMRTDIAPLVEAAANADSKRIIAIARPLLRQGAHGAELIGRVGMVAARADSDGHAVITLDAAAMLARMVMVLPELFGEEFDNHERELPLVVQGLLATAPVIRTGQTTQVTFAKPYYPSDLPEGKTLSDVMHDAVYGNDPVMVERILMGLYGTGADYRTIQIRSYDGIATTFQNNGHPLLYAVRGTQLLDAVEWSDRTPIIIHWLAPHLPIYTDEPAWIKGVRSFLSDQQHSLASIRTRLAAPQDEKALPLHELILSDADTEQICQAVYDALIKNGASPRGIASVIAFAAADLMQRVSDENRDAFIHAAHGLLFSSATRVAFIEIQDPEAYPLVFTSAAYINALSKELAQAATPSQEVTTRPTSWGGGLIATTLLDTLSEQIDDQDLDGALTTARRYLQLGNEARPLFAFLALGAAKADATSDQGHTLQIVQAAAEEYMGWPKDLANTNIDSFLHVALRAAIFAKRSTVVTNK